MSTREAPSGPPGAPGPPTTEPLRAKTLLAIGRVSNLPTVWMNVLTAALLCGEPLRAGPLLLLAASLSAFYCGGMVLNDVFDRDWDAEHQPFRPIPSGRISLSAARALAILLFAVAIGLLALAPRPIAIAPGLVLLALIFLYDRHHKQMAGAVFVMAATRAMVFVVTSSALGGAFFPLVAVVAMVFVVTSSALGGAFFPLVAVAAGSQLLYTVLVTAVARHENTRGTPYSFPLIPRMIAGMSVLDALWLAIFLHPGWLLAGVAAAGATLFGQRYVRGD